MSHLFAESQQQLTAEELAQRAAQARQQTREQHQKAMENMSECELMTEADEDVIRRIAAARKDPARAARARGEAAQKMQQAEQIDANMARNYRDQYVEVAREGLAHLQKVLGADWHKEAAQFAWNDRARLRERAFREALH